MRGGLRGLGSESVSAFLVIFQDVTVNEIGGVQFIP